MNFAERISKLFVTPDNVFAGIKKDPDYNGLIFTIAISFPFVIVSSLIFSDKIKYNVSNLIPESIVTFIKLTTLVFTGFGFVYGIFITWIELTFYVTILNKLLKKDFLFRELLPATNYILIPLILNNIAEIYLFNSLSPITIDITPGNNNSQSKIFEQGNKIYFNPVYIIVLILVFVITIYLLSSLISVYFEQDKIHSFILSSGYIVFEILRLLFAIIFIPLMFNLASSLQTVPS